MTFKEKINLWFHKNECFRITLFDDAKRVTKKIVRIKSGDKTIDLGSVSYVIDPEKVYYDEGIPSSIYHISNPLPINPETSKSDDMKSQTMNQMFKTKIVGDMIEGASEEGVSLKNIIFLGVAITVVALGIGLYLLYQEVQVIVEYIEENDDVIELIKDFLLNNGGR